MSEINCFNVLTDKQAKYFLDEINGWFKSNKYDFISVPEGFRLADYTFNFNCDEQEVNLTVITLPTNGRNLEKEGAFEKLVHLDFNFHFGRNVFGGVRFRVGTFTASVDNGEMKVKFDDAPIDACYEKLISALLASEPKAR